MQGWYNVFLLYSFVYTTITIKVGFKSYLYTERYLLNIEMAIKAHQTNPKWEWQYGHLYIVAIQNYLNSILVLYFVMLYWIAFAWLLMECFLQDSDTIIESNKHYYFINPIYKCYDNGCDWQCSNHLTSLLLCLYF